MLKSNDMWQNKLIEIVKRKTVWIFVLKWLFWLSNTYTVSVNFWDQKL